MPPSKISRPGDYKEFLRPERAVFFYKRRAVENIKGEYHMDYKQFYEDLENLIFNNKKYFSYLNHLSLYGQIESIIDDYKKTSEDLDDLKDKYEDLQNEHRFLNDGYNDLESENITLHEENGELNEKKDEYRGILIKHNLGEYLI